VSRLLKGLDASALQRVYEERLQLSPGAERLIAAVQAAGLKTLLVPAVSLSSPSALKTA
jgi:phosphoserine phosphatase